MKISTIILISGLVFSGGCLSPEQRDEVHATLERIETHLEDAGERAIMQRPDTGEVPAEEIAKSAVTVAGNPGNASAWYEIVEQVLYILGYGTGGSLIGWIFGRRRNK